MKSGTHTTGRLEARLPHDVLVRLKRAAEIQGRTLTDGVVAAADEAVCRAVEQTEIIRLSIEDQRHIAAALVYPPAPPAALKRGVNRYRYPFGAERRRPPFVLKHSAWTTAARPFSAGSQRWTDIFRRRQPRTSAARLRIASRSIGRLATLAGFWPLAIWRHR